MLPTTPHTLLASQHVVLHTTPTLHNSTNLYFSITFNTYTYPFANFHFPPLKVLGETQICFTQTKNEFHKGNTLKNFHSSWIPPAAMTPHGFCLDSSEIKFHLWPSILVKVTANNLVQMKSILLFFIVTSVVQTCPFFRWQIPAVAASPALWPAADASRLAVPVWNQPPLVLSITLRLSTHTEEKRNEMKKKSFPGCTSQIPDFTPPGLPHRRR